MPFQLHFFEDDWARIERDYEAWWAHELDRPLVQITGKKRRFGVRYPEVPTFLTNYPSGTSAEQIIAEAEMELEATRYYGDAYPRWWLNFGPGMMAGFLGARVHSAPETVWFEPSELRPAAELHPDYQADNPWWQQVKSLPQLAAQSWGRHVQVGHTDLGGNLDIVASLRTTQHLLTDLYDAPAEIERLVNEVTQLWLRYYDELYTLISPSCRGTTCWAPIWSAGKTYMLQCDFSYMISPAMFERFVLPDLAACCEHLDQAFYHLDGRGQIPHLDMLLSIPRLRGIQWIPGDGAPPPHEWLDLLKRIIDGGKLCQLFVSAESALSIVKNLGGKGFMLTVQDEMSEEDAGAFLARLGNAGSK